MASVWHNRNNSKCFRFLAFLFHSQLAKSPGFAAFWMQFNVCVCVSLQQDECTAPAHDMWYIEFRILAHQKLSWVHYAIDRKEDKLSWFSYESVHTQNSIANTHTYQFGVWHQIPCNVQIVAIA